MGVAPHHKNKGKTMLGEVKNIANLGVKPVPGECSYQVFRMRNGQYKEAQYQVGTVFQIEEQWQSGKMILVDPGGDRIFVSAGESQCFQEVDSLPKFVVAL